MIPQAYSLVAQALCGVAGIALGMLLFAPDTLTRRERATWLCVLLVAVVCAVACLRRA